MYSKFTHLELYSFVKTTIALLTMDLIKKEFVSSTRDNFILTKIKI